MVVGVCCAKTRAWVVAQHAVHAEQSTLMTGGWRRGRWIGERTRRPHWRTFRRYVISRGAGLAIGERVA